MVKFKRKETTQTILLVFSSFTVGIRRGLVCFWSMPTFKKHGPAAHVLFIFFTFYFLLGFHMMRHESARFGPAWSVLDRTPHVETEHKGTKYTPFFLLLLHFLIWKYCQRQTIPYSLKPRINMLPTHRHLFISTSLF